MRATPATASSVKTGYRRPESVSAFRTLNKLRTPLIAGTSTVFTSIGLMLPKENMLMKAWLLASSGLGYLVSAFCFVNNNKSDGVLSSEIATGRHDYYPSAFV